MSRGVESIFVTRQDVVLLRAEPIVAKSVFMAVRIRYSEPRLNQQSGSIVRSPKGLE
jgi:hypothetical protein